MPLVVIYACGLLMNFKFLFTTEAVRGMYQYVLAILSDKSFSPNFTLSRMRQGKQDRV